MSMENNNENNDNENQFEEVQDMNESVEENISEQTQKQDSFAQPVSDEDKFDGNADVPVEPKKKCSKGFITTVSVLVILIFYAATWLICANMGTGSSKKAINVSKFSKDDISGVYSDSNKGIYYSFELGQVEVAVPSEESDKAVDSSASSDASAASDAQKKSASATSVHDGKYKSGYTKEFIRNETIKMYIEDNSLNDDYKKYLKDKKITGDDYAGYERDKKIAEKVASFDNEKNITKSYQGVQISGTWCYEDKKIVVYDDSGKYYTTLEITAQGIVDTNGYMKGEVKPGTTFETKFSYEDKNYGATQTLYFYNDGNCIVKIDYKEGQSQSIAGTYVSDGSKLSLTVQEQTQDYTILKDGIAYYIFNR